MEKSYVALQNPCASIKKRGKTPRQICHVRYCEWALKITRNSARSYFEALQLSGRDTKSKENKSKDWRVSNTLTSVSPEIIRKP